MKTKIALALLLSALTATAQNTKYVGRFFGDGLGITNVATLNSGATVVNRGKLRWLTNSMSEINVKDFGAKGDNSTNDSPAIQSAFYFASSNSGVVYFPPGTYKIDDSLVVPYMGALGLTNRFKMRGDSWASTILRCPLLTNKHMIYVPGFWEQEAHFAMEGLYLKGAGEGRGQYSLLSQVQFTNVLVAIGNTNTYSPANLLGAFDTEIKRCRMEYGSAGLAMTNCQGLVAEDNWIQLNVRNVILAHVDTVKFLNGHYGSLLVTNRHEWLFGFNLIGTPWSTWGGTAADSGVHKIFEGLEHEGPFIYADGARFTVIGGQFELGQNTATAMTNGWCHLTNIGQYNFMGATISPPPNTNTFLFKLHNRASGGVKLIACSLNGSSDPLAASPRNYFFDIWRDGTDKNFYWPYWDSPVNGSDSANEATSTTVADFITRINARVDGTNYIHVKQKYGDTIQVADFKRNGKHYVRLPAALGRDASNRTLTNAPYAEGPSSVALTVLGANFQGYGLAWDTNLTSFRAWAFPAFIPERNVDGTMPLNYFVKVPLLSTNRFTNFLQIDASCLRLDGGGAQISNGNGSHGYFDTQTNFQYYSSTRTFSFEPKGQIVIRFGINASAWPVTNRIYMGDAEVEYW